MAASSDIDKLTFVTGYSDLMSLREIQSKSHKIAVDHGWWEKERSPLELIALLHSELSEMTEAFRANPNAPSEHVPTISAVAEEMADVIIRLGDMAEKYGIDLGSAVLQKMLYNESRPHRHGGKKY